MLCVVVYAVVRVSAHLDSMRLESVSLLCSVSLCPLYIPSIFLSSHLVQFVFIISLFLSPHLGHSLAHRLLLSINVF